LATCRAVATVITIAPPAALTLEDVGAVAAGARAVAGPGVAERMLRALRQLEARAAGGDAIYGYNTGCGPLCDRIVDDATRAAFQRNLIRSHASGIGTPHPPAVARATMLLRANSL